ncbi:MAG: hypothetical protein ABSH45_09995 [Bryobacteraceae bacterium]|jgi:hypothetical protein
MTHQRTFAALDPDAPPAERRAIQLRIAREIVDSPQSYPPDRLQWALWVIELHTMRSNVQ